MPFGLRLLVVSALGAAAWIIASLLRIPDVWLAVFIGFCIGGVLALWERAGSRLENGDDPR